MKRILVFSDSHGDTRGMCDIIEKIIGVDMIVHCGDYSKDAIHLRKTYRDIPVISVCGNNEFGNTFDELFEIIEIDNVKIYVTHGHKEGVKSGYDKLVNTATSKNCSVCLFGHTHRAVCEKQGEILLLNPGSARGFAGTYGVLEIEDGKVRGAFLSIN